MARIPTERPKVMWPAGRQKYLEDEVFRMTSSSSERSAMRARCRAVSCAASAARSGLSTSCFLAFGSGLTCGSGCSAISPSSLTAASALCFTLLQILNVD